VSLENEMRALRASVGFSDGATRPRTCLRLAGRDAFAAVEAICPRELFIRDGQMLHTLLLDERAKPVADVYVCADGEDFLLICEGPDAETLSSLIAARCPGGADLKVENLTADHELLSLDGPYAWELLSEVISPEVIGLPYLGFFRGPDFVCFRAGTTGEFSYDLLIAKDAVPAWRTRILKIGAAFDLAPVSAAALDLCALENFFFNIRRDVTSEVTPVELQLQWRISYKKDYVGSEAARRRRREKTRRAVLVAAREEIGAGDTIKDPDGGASIGTVVQGAFSFDRKEWLGLALVDLPHASTGVAVVLRSGGRNAGGTVISAPALNNRSLYVDPQRHNYATRDRDAFPPLILSAASP
jgi:glycine cleavage system aminomethyltransferase T